MVGAFFMRVSAAGISCFLVSLAALSARYLLALQAPPFAAPGGISLEYPGVTLATEWFSGSRH